VNSHLRRIAPGSPVQTIRGGANLLSDHGDKIAGRLAVRVAVRRQPVAITRRVHRTGGSASQ
jgi:hypothetical protein